MTGSALPREHTLAATGFSKCTAAASAAVRRNARSLRANSDYETLLFPQDIQRAKATKYAERKSRKKYVPGNREEEKPLHDIGRNED